MGLLKTDWYDYDGFMGIEGVACNHCTRKTHNPFTWIICRKGRINSYLYFRSDAFCWLDDKWTDFKERFTEKCSFCTRSNILRPTHHHSYHGLNQDDDRYGKKWCQGCWNERVGEGGCGFDSGFGATHEQNDC